MCSCHLILYVMILANITYSLYLSKKIMVATNNKLEKTISQLRYVEQKVEKLREDYLETMYHNKKNKYGHRDKDFFKKI